MAVLVSRTITSARPLLAANERSIQHDAISVRVRAADLRKCATIDAVVRVGKWPADTLGASGTVEHGSGR